MTGSSHLLNLMTSTIRGLRSLARAVDAVALGRAQVDPVCDFPAEQAARRRRTRGPNPSRAELRPPHPANRPVASAV